MGYGSHSFASEGWCGFTTTLETILAKIPEKIRKSNQWFSKRIQFKY